MHVSITYMEQFSSSFNDRLYTKCFYTQCLLNSLILEGMLYEKAFRLYIIHAILHIYITSKST